MTLLANREYLNARRAVTDGALQPLAVSLAEDLRRVIARPLYVPEQKALLSREGGRCPTDGTMLEFDPFSPHEHRCPKCGMGHRGELHDGFWIYWYQLWLAERAVHAALLSRLGVLPEAAAFAASVLDAYSDRYLKYPNVDNALGPTRPFFSTYLESIWLLQLCIASRFLDRTANSKVLLRFEGAVVEPSLALIESYDEGGSNRQVWNNAAMIAGHLTLGRRKRAEEIIRAESGLVYHLGTSLLDDGTWYEGENYHLFAHRGLWYGIELVKAAGFELPADLLSRYERGFVTPFLTSLPDLTFPSRRDSQYAISLRQWRFAEWCELGLARSSDRVLEGMLSRLYADDVPRGDTGRWKSTAEAERNLPPVRLGRADLGWKSLLFAREQIEGAEGRVLPSTLLDAQGIGVIRRDQGKVYVALDYGVSGGGHGHPDRLNLVLCHGQQRILDDMGTGSYVDPSLHWYRSSLAHNAPFLDGRSQPRVDGTLVAYEDRGAAGWICAKAPLGHDAIGTRAVVAMPDYLVDQVSCSASEVHRFDLPYHADLSPVDGPPAVSGKPEGGLALEDGFGFIRDAQLVARVGPNETMAFAGPLAKVWIGSSEALDVWRATAPGAPGQGDAPLLLVRGAAPGVIRSVWSWSDAVRDVTLFPAISVETGRERHEHAAVTHGWQVAIHVNGAKSTIDLEGMEPESEIKTNVFLANARLGVPPTMVQPFKNGQLMHGTLGRAHYLRSEQTWMEAGSPTADVEVVNDSGTLRITADVHADRTFVPPGSINRLDNEHADINGAGLQLYLRSGDVTAGYVIVPIAGGNALSMRPIDGWGASIAVSGSWRETRDGYHVDLAVKPPTSALSFNIVINEKPPGRERRRGQLTLQPPLRGESQWVYLRGDRPPTQYTVELKLEE